ncbi:MAG: chemotaxis-specific protein-glutamate methyltransferase CheB [Bdellovibrionota bacterium]
MNFNRIDLANCDAVVINEQDYVHLQEVSGFIVALIIDEISFRGIIRVDLHNADQLVDVFNKSFQSWVKEYSIDKARNGFIKFVAPRGLESVFEQIPKMENFDYNGRFYAATDAIEVIFGGNDGRFRVAGLVKNNRSNAVRKRIRDTKVLIVDDSKTIQQLLSHMITSFEGFTVVGVSEKPGEVDQLISELKPDVMTLDLNMPEMNGIDLLKIVFPKYHIPTLIVSSVNATEGTKVIEALEVGAIDYVHKTSMDQVEQMKAELETKLNIAADESLRKKIEERRRNRANNKKEPVKLSIDINVIKVDSIDQSKIITIGASTGGTEAIREVLQALPPNAPPILITQHIPPYFSTAFAKRLNEITPFSVREGKNNDIVRSGEVVVAPGDTQMEVSEQLDGAVKIKISDGPKVSNHKPSVDVLFSSACRVYGDKVVAALLTGMGKDGASGLLNLKNAGAYTVIQNEESCVVYGMPKAAEELNAHCDVVSLEKIAKKLYKHSEYQEVKQKRIS